MIKYSNNQSRAWTHSTGVDEAAILTVEVHGANVEIDEPRVVRIDGVGSSRPVVLCDTEVGYSGSITKKDRKSVV